MIRNLALAILLSLPLLTSGYRPIAAGERFVIHVIDQNTGRGLAHVRFVSDTGITCFTNVVGDVGWNEAELMNRGVYFAIESPGYRLSGGGATLYVRHGGRAELKLKRDALSLAFPVDSPSVPR